MNRKDIKLKVEDLIASGVAKSMVFRTLSGGDVEDRTLAYVIVARIDPHRCEANKWRIRILVMIAYVEVPVSFLACFGIGMKFSPLVGVALAIVGALISYLFARGFQHNKVAAYNGFMMLSIGGAPNQLAHFSLAPTATGIGMAIGLALCAYVWSLRKRLFPDFAFMSPRKVDGAYVFDDSSSKEGNEQSNEPQPVSDQWSDASMKVKLRGKIPLLEQETPKAVKIAVLLFALVWCGEIYFLLPLFLYAIQHGFVSETQRSGSALLVVLLVSWLLLNAVLTLGVVYRKNWARLTEMSLTLFGMVLIAVSVAFRPAFKPGILYFANAAATVLLFLPRTNTWFNPAKTAIDASYHDKGT